MSDKNLARLASDPVRSIKYGAQLSGFSQSMDKRIQSRQMSTRYVENDSLNRLERRLSNIGSSSTDFDDFENEFDADELRAIKVSQPSNYIFSSLGSSLYRPILARPKLHPFFSNAASDTAHSLPHSRMNPFSWIEIRCEQSRI